MKIYKYWTFMSILSIVLCFASCSKDEFIEDETTIDIGEPIEESGDFVAGVILDFEDNPISDVLVTLSVQDIEIASNISDSEGRYRVDVLDMEPTSAILTFEKEGFQSVRKLVETGAATAVNSKLAMVSCLVREQPDPIIVNTEELVTISGRAFHANGEPAVNSKVWISQRDPITQNLLYLDIAVIDNEGYWDLIVPKDQSLSFLIDLGTECNAETRDEIGPFSDHTELPTLTGLDKTLTLNVLGKAVSCDGSELSEGVIRYYINDFFNLQSLNNLFSDDAEYFEDCYVTCNLDYTHGVLAYEAISNQYAIVKRPFEEVIDFGNVPVCTPLESSVKIQFDGESIDVDNASHIYKIYKGFFVKETEFSFVVDDILVFSDKQYSFKANSKSILEAGKTFNEFNSFTVTDKVYDLNYANFDGDFTISEITDGYAIGTIDGTIFQTVEKWPQAQYTSVGPPIKITGDFKILVY